MPEAEKRREEDLVRQAMADLQDIERRPAAVGGAKGGPLRGLLDVIQQVNAELDLDKVLRLASRRIIDVFEAERVFLFELDANRRFYFRLSETFDGEDVTEPETEISHAIVREVAEKRRPLLVADATTDPRFAKVSSVQHLQLHSVMAAPLVALDQVLGVVYLDNRLSVDAFDQEKLDLLQVFANHLGIAVRNAQLFQRLSDTRAQLAQAERVKTIGEVAGFLAHKIKNPLSSLKLQAGMLDTEWEDKSFRRDFATIVGEAILRMEAAVDGLSRYARPTPLSMERVRIQEVMTSALRMLTPEIQAHGIDVVTSLREGDVLQVTGDAECLREAIVNLIKNGIEAMAGQPVRQLRLSAAGPERGRIEICVEDTGTGIPEDELEAIFEPFRTTKRSGTGLGLPFCAKSVREHGGSITAENWGRGARFRIILPASGL